MKQKIVSFAYDDENLSDLHNFDSRDYLMALKYGYLLKKTNKWYKGGQWYEKFFVLSSVGLIYMEKPSDKDVKLFPFLDFNIHKVPESEFNKKWVILLETLKGKDFDLYLHAFSEEEFKEWMAALTKFKAQLETAKKDKLKGYISK